MSDPDLKSLESKFDELALRLELLNKRIDRLEQPSSSPAPSPPQWQRINPVIVPRPPSVAQPPSPPPQTPAPRPTYVPPPKQSEPPAAPVGAQKVDDLEYKIGLTGLLRGGAVIVIIGIIYLVALVSSRGMLSAPIRFAGEIALCLAFIGIGFWKQTEREEFGQLMMGIGSCGLYLSFAGGHLYKDLYSGEILVGLFVALSFVNLAFSWWRSSRTFLAIGMIGGLVAAILPMNEGKLKLDIGLHFLILVPTVLLIIKNRWARFAVFMWLASTLALGPAFTFHGHWLWRMAAMYANSLIGALAYALSFEGEDEDPNCLFVPFALAVGAIGGVCLDEVAHRPFHVLLLALSALVLSRTRRSKPEVERAWQIGAAIVAFTVLPFGLVPWQAALVYAVSAMGFAAISVRSESRAFGLYSYAQFFLGVIAYGCLWKDGPISVGIGIEGMVLASLAASACLSAFAMVKSGSHEEQTAFLASFLTVPMLARIAFSGLNVGMGESLGLSLFLPGLLIAVAVFAVGRRQKWTSFIGIGWVLQMLLIFGYVQFVATNNRGPYFDAFTVLAFGGAMLYGAICHESTTSESKGETIPLAGVSIACLIIRFVFVILSIPSLHIWPNAAFGAGAAVSALFGLLAIRRFGYPGLFTPVWGSIIAGSFYDVLEGPGSLGQQTWPIPLKVTFIALIIASITIQRRRSPQIRFVLAIGVLLSWLQMVSISYEILVNQLHLVTGDAAVTIAWISLGASLIALGFRYSFQEIRFWSFAVFLLTIGKIFLIDLASLDGIIRVALLLGLGVVMIAGGYLYIRSSRSPIASGNEGKPE